MNRRAILFVAVCAGTLLTALEAVGQQCPHGSQWNGAGCVKMHVPANAKVNAFNTGWECIRGYTRGRRRVREDARPCEREGQRVQYRVGVYSGLRAGWRRVREDAHPCEREGQRFQYRVGVHSGLHAGDGAGCVKMRVPANAKVNAFNTGWECIRGYTRDGAGCVKMHVPANAKVNAFNTGWECIRGYARDGAGCVKMRIPANAKVNAFNTGWECIRGYTQDGAGCVKMHVPANAKVNAFNTGWECIRGYTRDGAGCVKMHVPANAKVNAFNTGWECIRGYTRGRRRVREEACPCEREGQRFQHRVGVQDWIQKAWKWLWSDDPSGNASTIATLSRRKGPGY